MELGTTYFLLSLVALTMTAFVYVFLNIKNRETKLKKNKVSDENYIFDGSHPMLKGLGYGYIRVLNETFANNDVNKVHKNTGYNPDTQYKYMEEIRNYTGAESNKDLYKKLLAHLC